ARPLRGRPAHRRADRGARLAGGWCRRAELPARPARPAADDSFAGAARSGERLEDDAACAPGSDLADDRLGDLRWGDRPDRNRSVGEDATIRDRRGLPVRAAIGRTSDRGPALPAPGPGVLRL